MGPLSVITANFMKRILLALAAALVLVTVYTITLALVVALSGKYWIISYLGVPVSLPKTVYFYIFPPTADDFSSRVTEKKILLTMVAYLINILLYSIPFYILFTIIARRRRKFPTTQPEPPLPPSFGS